MGETQVRSLGWEDPLEKETANHSSTLAWKIPWAEEPGSLQSMGLQRVGHDWATSLSLSVLSNSMTPWTVTHQAFLSIGFPRQEYLNRLRFPLLGDLPKPRDRTGVSCTSCIAGGFFILSHPINTVQNTFAFHNHITFLTPADLTLRWTF